MKSFLNGKYWFFSSDALSSVAYATEEILLVLALIGSSAFVYSVPIAAVIIALLFIVTLSYRQIIYAFPSGGGAYVVAKEHLNTRYSLVAGAALLIDYVLTVAVSISSGTAALLSAFPALLPWRVEIAVALVLVLMVLNLRGIRESATIFAYPTYLFVGCTLILIITEFINFLSTEGVEAISNGVSAFRQPPSRNAARTMAWMSVLLAVMFFGITALSTAFGVKPKGDETVISQIAEHVWGNGPFYYLFQMSTVLILFLASKTCYSAFPQLASVMAQDGFLPRSLTIRGDRLVFSNGIMLLSIVAIALIIGFKGDTHALIPLYAVGVFLSFTIAQWGMVKHFKENHPENRWKIGVARLGTAVTGVVVIVIGMAKFTEGAWLVVVSIPLLYLVSCNLSPLPRYF